LSKISCPRLASYGKLHLATFICDGESLEALFAELSNVEKLQELYLDGCHVSSLSNNTLAPVNKLRVLSITNSKIDSIEPSAFNSLHKLNTLHLNKSLGQNEKS
jgi:Leucine-rich repeat (LRR) protein